MHTPNNIGTLAEKIIAVKIDCHGILKPILRQRQLDGRMTDCLEHAIAPCTTPSAGADFVVRVSSGSNGIVVMRPNYWPMGGDYFSAVVPVGSTRPFSDFDSSAPDSGDAAWDAPDAAEDEIRFHYAGDKLVWTNGKTAGEMRIDESFPELTVALRLPPGSNGEIEFASPLFTNASGEQTGLLSVA